MKWLTCFLMLMSGFVFASGETIYVVEQKEIDQKPLQYTGTLVPGNVAEIISPANGIITKRFVNFGSQVKKDQVLFEFASNELTARLAEEKMKLLENTQVLEKLKHWQTSSEMVQAQYNLDTAEQEYNHAERRYEQTKKLFEAGIVSKEEYSQDARFHRDSLHHYEHAKKNLSDVQRKGGEQYVTLAQMKETQSQQQVKILTDKIAALTIRSPLTGVFLPPMRQEESKDNWGLSHQRTSFQENQALGLVADSDQLYVQIKVDEFDIVKIHKGQSAQISILALQDIKVKGKIDDINVMINKGSSNQQAASFDVKIIVENLDNKLKEKILLGMSASVKLAKPALQGLFVPKLAVVYEKGEAFVDVLVDEKNHQKQKIEVGDTSNNYVVVTQGIKPGDRIVVHS